MSIHETVSGAIGGPFDCYPPGWPTHWPHRPTTAAPVVDPTYAMPTTPLPNVYEQMGADPISKLAAAIEHLAQALEKRS